MHLCDPGGRVIAEGPFTLGELSNPPSTPALRVVTLCPSNAEIVGALAAFERVVACEDSSDWPAEVDTRERLDPTSGLTSTVWP